MLYPNDSEIYITNHGPRGGDFFGKVEAGTNYGWADVAWGGTIMMAQLLVTEVHGKRDC